MEIECVYDDKEILEHRIMDIIESGDKFIVRDFPLDGDVRNYRIFLNSYVQEKRRRQFKDVCNFFRRGAYENGLISGAELLGFS